MTDEEREKLFQQGQREDRRIKAGMLAIGGLMLLGVFSAVSSVWHAGDVPSPQPQPQTRIEQPQTPPAP